MQHYINVVWYIDYILNGDYENNFLFNFLIRPLEILFNILPKSKTLAEILVVMMMVVVVMVTHFSVGVLGEKKM